MQFVLVAIRLSRMQNLCVDYLTWFYAWQLLPGAIPASPFSLIFSCLLPPNLNRAIFYLISSIQSKGRGDLLAAKVLIFHKAVRAKELTDLVKYTFTEDEKSKQCLVSSVTQTTGQTPCCDIPVISVQLVSILVAKKMHITKTLNRSSFCSLKFQWIIISSSFNSSYVAQLCINEFGNNTSMMVTNENLTDNSLVQFSSISPSLPLSSSPFQKWMKLQKFCSVKLKYILCN